MRLTIRHQILSLAAGGFVMVTMAGLIGYQGISQLEDTQREAGNAAAALEAVGTADTARVAFRGDVLNAITTRDSAERQKVLDLLGSHVSELRGSFAQIVRLRPELAGELKELDAATDEMIAAGQRVVTLASRVVSDPRQVGAAEARPDFESRYRRFDEMLPELEKAIADEAEGASAAAEATASDAKTLTLVTAGLAAVLLGGAAVLLARRVSRRIGSFVLAMKALADKDLTVRADIGGTDELAELGKSLDEVVTTVRGAIGEIADNAAALISASARLSDTSRDLASGAQTAADQAGSASSNVDQVSESVSSTSQAAQSLQASIRDINGAVTEAVEVAAEAVGLATTTNRTIERLRTSSGEVGAVVNMITSIAQQTNLLALNATIEAARAGEQGKGFAVVAGEVKDLSQETASATEDIESKVAAMRGDTENAIEAIGRIGTVINRIDEIQRSIVAAIEVQSQATQSIGAGIEVVSRSSNDITGSILNVAEATRTTHDGATRTEMAATELAELAHNLNALAERFQR
ncbi:methyl-accepting chemotaxis protein [Planobispora rosea]|uniref:Methyl-accepting chemotaxis protein n=1 Tax=Planobispora rosea TaxID=35762 RepID=A0A8J3S4W5_PLARO|nr:methyl-accepting chemotaxis protein [Planobispora rosea]GGS92695.1 methyl-accepting chemotaxis protein [Planobispora rosea]GIH87233.1 methyl-accepting chemotaxis protein [Planobispora rosea]